MPSNEAAPHILVIDDTPQLLELFQELLGDEGYRVTTDRFTVETDRLLAAVKAAQPDLLILDFMIGDEQQGWQFLQMLQLDRETRPIPVIVCTAAVQLVSELQPHLDAMGVAVVLKPFDIERLLEVVGQALDPNAVKGTPLG